MNYIPNAILAELEAAREDGRREGLRQARELIQARLAEIDGQLMHIVNNFGMYASFERDGLNAESHGLDRILDEINEAAK